MLFHKITYYLERMQEKGFAKQIREMMFDFYYSRKLKPYDYLNPNDFSLSHPIQANDMVVNQSANKDSHRNVSTPYCYIFDGLKSVPLKPRNIYLLDYGCGNGRVLVSAMSFGAGKVIGIDLDKEGLSASQINCKNAGKKYSTTQVEITMADASLYAIPADVNVVFLCNPFGEETLQKVIDNIYTSYSKNNRPLFVVYCYPMLGHLFAKHPGFKLYYTNQLKTGYTGLITYQLV